MTVDTLELIRPHDDAYEKSCQIWNGIHTSRPYAVARCWTARDVAAALRVAVAEGVPVTVRGGGHGVAGTAIADGALMIDLSPMNAVHVDPAAHVAIAGGGSLLRDLDAATAPFNLACPAGVVGHTGLGGLTLGGGYGWLARRWGLTCDHVLAAEVVLADGTIVEASPHHEPELFWALRGGGGNFGVVTRFTLRLRAVGPVHQQIAVYPLDNAAAALAAYRTLAPGQPLDLHMTGAFRDGRDQTWIGEGLRDVPALFLTSAWFGDPEKVSDQVSRLHDMLSPAAVSRSIISYAALQAQGDHGEPYGHRYYTKSCYLADLHRDTIHSMISAARARPSALSSLDFEYLGGAIRHVPDGSSAFPNRNANYIYTASAHWTAPQEDRENTGWSRESIDAVGAASTGAAYVNYLQDEEEGKFVRVYGSERHGRLVALKSALDPGNLLLGNRNLVPVGADSSQRNP